MPRIRKRMMPRMRIRLMPRNEERIPHEKQTNPGMPGRKWRKAKKNFLGR